MVNILKFLAKIISPPFCEQCRVFLDRQTILCQSCFLKIRPIAPYHLKINGNLKIPVYAIGPYEQPLQGLVLAKKRSYRLAAIYLAELIYAKTPLINLPCDFLVPVPQHWARTFKRGYNPSIVMANKLQELFDGFGDQKYLVANILRRIRATKYQTGLSKIERASNVYGAFALKKINSKLYLNKDSHFQL